MLIMKILLKTSTSVLLLCLATLLLSFVPEGKPKFKDLWKPIGDNVYARISETSVLDYREFLQDIKLDKEEYEKHTPDISIWERHHSSFQKLGDNYYTHPAFYEYPVIGISHKSALAYCAWLTEVVNKSGNTPFKKVKFRLPTEEEWERAAGADLEDPKFPWQLPIGMEIKDNILDKKGKYRCNFKVIDQSYIQKDPESGKSIIVNHGTNLSHDGYMFTAPVKSFEPNPWGLFNLAGNVSEMIDEPGIAKGGSWFSTGYYLRIQSQEKYDKPLSTIGFRVFMEVIEE